MSRISWIGPWQGLGVWVIWEVEEFRASTVFWAGIPVSDL